MVSSFYKGSDGCVLAFDVMDKDSFESLNYWRTDFLQKVIPTEQSFPMVVLGNKIDLKEREVRKGKVKNAGNLQNRKALNLLGNRRSELD